MKENISAKGLHESSEDNKHGSAENTLLDHHSHSHWPGSRYVDIPTSLHSCISKTRNREQGSQDGDLKSSIATSPITILSPKIMWNRKVSCNYTYALMTALKFERELRVVCSAALSGTATSMEN